MPRTTPCRLLVLHKNVANILSKITGTVGNAGVNIAHLSNQSKGNFAATMIDADADVSDSVAKEIKGIDGVIKVRVIK